MAIPDFKSLLASSSRGTAALMGEAIAGAFSSKRRRDKKKAIMAFVGANLFNIMDQKTMWNNMKKLAKFEADNQTNIEYINQRGEERKNMVKEFDKWGGKLQASDNDKGYVVLNEEDMKRNWRLAQMDKHAIERKHSYGIDGPLGKEVMDNIALNEATWYKNLTERAGQYDWGRTDAGLKDSYTKAKQAAETYYGDPSRQGWIGSWLDGTFGGDEEKQAVLDSQKAMTTEINNWRSKANQIESAAYAKPHVMPDVFHAFDSNQLARARDVYENRLTVSGKRDTRIGRIPGDTYGKVLEMGPWIKMVQKNYSDNINATGGKGMNKDEAFYHAVVGKSHDIAAVKFDKLRNFQKHSITEDLRKKLNTSDKDGNFKYQAELATELEGTAFQSHITNWAETRKDPAKVRELVDYLVINNDDWRERDKLMEASALKDTYGLSESLAQTMAKSLISQTDALSAWRRGEIDRQAVLGMFPKLLDLEPELMYETYIGQYLTYKRSGYILDAQFEADIFRWGLSTGDINGWARWAALKHVKVMMDAQNRTEAYDTWLKGSKLLTETDKAIEALKQKVD
ncbi:MAG: hypothetical protein CMI54_00860 [Parcubacteria group bacterium]|nr:hypothetical protein [Parcubacteria group bacterium]